ncbi:hypothetical protein GF336_07010 [Candidatus Woesearchaeota archaeon]|nr:hypothetical protein [Candidatus Woesearchaeota archaeon]
MHKLFRSKKAIGIDDFIPLMVTLFFFIIAIFIFLAFSGDAEDDREKNADILKQEIDGKQILIHYLRTPVKVDLNKMESEKPIDLAYTDMAGLITLLRSDEYFEDEWVKQTEQALQKYASRCIVVCIDRKKYEFKDCFDYYTSCSGAKQYIPYGNKTVEIKMDASFGIEEMMDAP